MERKQRSSIGKRKRSDEARPSKPSSRVKPSPKKQFQGEDLNEEGPGLDSSDEGQESLGQGYESEEDDDETPAQKRLRLAKMYLESIEKGQKGNILLSVDRNILIYSVECYREGRVRRNRSR